MSVVIPKISQLSKSIWRILGCNPSPMTLQGNNVYLLGKGEARILIDAGPKDQPEYVDNLKKVLKQQNATVQHLILTHWHRDHTGGLEDLIPVFKDVCGGLPRVHKFPRLDNHDDDIPAEYDFEELKDGQLFKLDGLSLRTVYTPGHTSDHASMHYLEENILFAGDSLLGEGTGVFEDLSEYLSSLYAIRALKPSKIFCGHGPVIHDTEEKLAYNINHHLMREKRVYRILDEVAPESLTTSDIVAKMYRVLSAPLRNQAAVSVKLHLNKLHRENKIKEEHGRYYVNKCLVGG